MGTRGASVSERFQEVVQTVAAHLCISALFSLLTLLLSTAVSLVFMRSVLLCGALRLLPALGEGQIGGFFSGGGPGGLLLRGLQGGGGLGGLLSGSGGFLGSLLLRLLGGLLLGGLLLLLESLHDHPFIFNQLGLRVEGVLLIEENELLLC